MARDGKSPQLRLLVPTPLCGSIIGKGGATIRSFAEDSQAAITVSPQACRPQQALLYCRCPSCRGVLNHLEGVSISALLLLSASAYAICIHCIQ